MIRIKKKNSDFSSAELALIVQKIKQGQILILPTDTIYGLSCLSLNKKALEKIVRIKKRASDKPFINLVSSLSMAKKYASIKTRDEKEIQDIWLNDKRPTTIILPAKKNLPRQMLSQIVSKDGTISLRLPKSDFLIKIIRKVGAPLISTSLNLSGEKPLSNLNSLNKYFLPSNQPDLIIDIGELKKAKPSTIIDWRFNPPKVIRK